MVGLAGGHEARVGRTGGDHPDDGDRRDDLLGDADEQVGGMQAALAEAMAGDPRLGGMFVSMPPVTGTRPEDVPDTQSSDSRARP